MKKKILSITLALLLLPILAHAQAIDWTKPFDLARSNYILGAAAPPPAGCTWGSGDSAIFDYSSETTGDSALAGGYKFTIATSKMITGYKFRAVYVGDDSDIWGEIFTNDTTTSGCETDGCLGVAVSGTVSQKVALSHTVEVTTTTLATPYTLSAGTYWLRRWHDAGRIVYLKINYQGTRAWDGNGYYNGTNATSGLFGCTP